MEALTYYLKANLVFGVLLGTYVLVLRRETWFQARRVWLLLSPLLAILLPLAPKGDATMLYTVELPAVVVGSVTGSANSLPWSERFILMHAAVTVVLLLALGMRVLQAWKGIRRDDPVAASFLGHIRIPDTLHPMDREAVMAHEGVHVREHHSRDVIYYEIIRACAWSNPFVHIALRELRLVHELIADRSAEPLHPDYRALLVANAMGTRSGTLMTTFSSTNLKQRLTMLQNDRPASSTRPKLLFILPAMILAFGLIAWQPASEPRPDKPATVFNGNDTPAEFPGGMEALVKYLSTHVKYPAAARKDGTEGTVHVGFIVKSNGELAEITVKRGVRADIDSEALRVVTGMPAWKPARSNGKDVSSQMVLPIAFRLD